MSPSTKNLRERIREALHQIIAENDNIAAEELSEVSRQFSEVLDNGTAEILSLLSSELSLAVKGLRESLEEQVRLRERNAIHAIDGELAEETQMKLNVSKFDLQAFDAKAKEILGESS